MGQSNPRRGSRSTSGRRRRYVTEGPRTRQDQATVLPVPRRPGVGEETPGLGPPAAHVVRRV